MQKPEMRHSSIPCYCLKLCFLFKGRDDSGKLGLPPSKTQEFWCFRISQAPKKMMELNPSYQSTKIRLSSCGAVACSPKIYRMLNYICLLKTHETSKWSIVSPTWSQSGHLGGRSRPHHASLSVVQHLLWVDVHMKNVHFPRAQLFQISSQGLK